MKKLPVGIQSFKKIIRGNYTYSTGQMKDIQLTVADQQKVITDAKLDEAMAQIHERGYYKKFEGSGKKIYLTAFAFLGRDIIDMRVVEHDDNAL